MFGWWQRTYFCMFTSKIPIFDEHIFQMGLKLNHQLDVPLPGDVFYFGGRSIIFSFQVVVDEFVFSPLLLKDVETIVEASHGLKNAVSDIHAPLHRIYTLKLIGPSYGRV